MNIIAKGMLCASALAGQAVMISMILGKGLPITTNLMTGAWLWYVDFGLWFGLGLLMSLAFIEPRR